MMGIVLSHNIFNMVCDQHIMEQGRSVGIMIEPIFKVMEELEVIDKIECLRLIKTIYYKIIEKVNT